VCVLGSVIVFGGRGVGGGGTGSGFRRLELMWVTKQT